MKPILVVLPENPRRIATASSVLLVASQPPQPSNPRCEVDLWNEASDFLTNCVRFCTHVQFVAGFVVHGDTHAWNKPSTRRAEGM